MTEQQWIDPSVAPSGEGCKECEQTNGWWLHLRRCASCGHIGCCDTSPSQHATAHAKSTGHPLITSFESFDLLYSGRGLPLDTVVERLTETAERALMSR